MNLILKRQSHKMVKPTQTNLRQQPTNCLSVFDHFVELALKGLKRLYFSRAVFLFEIQKNQIIQNNQ